LTHSRFPFSVARLRDQARQCRLASLKMEPSIAKLAMARLAARWDVMAEQESKRAHRLLPAND